VSARAPRPDLRSPRAARPSAPQVLLENREWSEGLVTQYHRSSGKHCVEFRHSGARRWLMMLRTAFYIVDRGASGEETKEPDGAGPSSSKAPPEPWTYSEDLSTAFARAQSTMHECYGGRTQETGHKTLGHICVTEEDKRSASESHGSLLYGELLPRGVNKALDGRHLDAQRASCLFDLGMGTGKVAMQAFLQFPNLKRVYGVELSLARYKVAERACLKLASTDARALAVHSHAPGTSIAVKNVATQQILHVVHGNLMQTRDIERANIIMLETEIPSDSFSDFSVLLDAARDGARVLTYLDLRKVWQLPGQPFPFRQLEANRSFADRYPTSWSVHRGHHLFLWVKVLKPGPAGAQHASGQRAADRESDRRASRGGPGDHHPTHASISTLAFNASSSLAHGGAHGSKTAPARKSNRAAAAPSWADDLACAQKWPALVSRSSKKPSSSHSTCVIA
jgi:hypothetical protein